MVKKKLKKKVRTKPSVNKISGLPGVESAREVWLAGLGALNVAQSEGGKILEQGNKLFETLVTEGKKLEKKTRKDVEGVVSDVVGEVESRVKEVKSQSDSVRKQATDNWDKLESIFEERVSRAMGSLGIPNRDEINELTRRVNELTAEVATLTAPVSRVAPKNAAPKKAAPKKAAPKKAAPKKAAPKKVAPMKAAPKVVAKNATRKKTVTKKSTVKKTARK